MSFRVCYIISEIDNFANDPKNQGGHNSIGYFKYYCPDNNCDTDVKKVISTFIALVTLFNGINHNEKLESDKIAEYAILWLSYKLNQKTQNGTTKLYDFYTEHINTNSKYNEHITNDFNINKSVIENKIKLMNMNIKDISKFYDAFKKLCEMNTEFDDDNKNCTNCSGKAKEFVEKYKDLNKDYNNTNSSSYNKMLSTLSTDYNNLKNKCKNVQNSKFPLLPEIKTTQISVKSSEQTSAQTSEVASSRSSIGNNLFTVLSVFGAIALFLGIGYKHSLFGFRRKVQKNLRKKLKSLRRKWIISI
ncbi:BIR protein [Plasmodium berghei]|uniref:BIR protein n=1 Tax=Plasmodium berghei TaxID=5821 RepID=A0A1D3JNM6_PLABE|nr:BIR protein [Plasmodium berghei]